MKPIPRQAVATLEPYVPGRSGAKSGPSFKLSSNESALGPSPAALAAYAAAAASLHLYPDGAAQGLRLAIAAARDLPAEELIIGAGSDELILLLLRAYAAEGDSMVQSAHGFSYYQVAARGAGIEPIFAPENDLHADVDAIAAAVTATTRMVFLANPNNPTGTVLDRAALRRLRALLPPEVILVIDAAYAEYVEAEQYSSGADLVRESISAGTDNVVMLRTFSKIYGLGGLRVGWAYAPASIIDLLNRLRPPFNVNGPALAAAAAAIGDHTFVARNRQYTVEARAMLATGLGALGCETVPSAANFVLFTPPGPLSAEQARRVLVALEAEGVFIRWAASSGLPCHLRVSVGAPDANAAFLAAMARALGRAPL